MRILARISPSAMVIALPNTGKKAKNPIQAPYPPINLTALSSFSLADVQVSLNPFYSSHASYEKVEHTTQHIADGAIDNESPWVESGSHESHRDRFARERGRRSRQ